MSESLPSSLDQRVAALFIEGRKIEDQPPHPRFSNAADCLKKHVYAARDFAAGTWTPQRERPVRWNLASVFGTAAGEFLEKAAVRLGATTQKEVRLSGGAAAGDGIEVVGHLDILWADEVWDIKFVSDYAYREVQRGGAKYAHVFQVNGYMAAEGKARGALIYVKASSVGKGEEMVWLAIPVAYDAEMAAELLARWRSVEDHAAAKTMPERPFDEPGFECRNCHYALECWEIS